MRNIYTAALLLLCLQSKAQQTNKNHHGISIKSLKGGTHDERLEIREGGPHDWIVMIKKDTIYVHAGDRTFKTRFTDTLYSYGDYYTEICTKDTIYFLPLKK